MYRTVTLLWLCLLSAFYCHAQARSRPVSHTMFVGGAVNINGIADSVVEVSRVMDQPVLRISNTDCEIIGFDFALTEDGKTEVFGPIHIKGAAFDAKAVEALKQLKKNGRIFIDNVTMKCKDKEAVAYPIQLGVHP